MNTPKFHSYPEEWGMQLHYTGQVPTTVSSGDFEVLGKLKEMFKKRHGDVLSWKFDLKPLVKEMPGILTVLDRLWKAGVVVKFAKQFFTKQDQRPEYIYWYIWEDVDGQKFDPKGRDTGAAHYIVQR